MKNTKLTQLKQNSQMVEKDLWQRVETSSPGLGFLNTNSKTHIPSYIQSKSGWVKYLKALITRPAFAVGLFIMIVLLLLAIIAPEVTTFTKVGEEQPDLSIGERTLWKDDAYLNSGELGRGGATHLFGTDETGSDLWSIIWYGLRNTLAITFSVVGATLLLGVTIGLIIGYFRLADWFFQRVIKVLSNIPILLILAIMTTILGRTLEGLIIAFILFSWLSMTMQVRAQVFRVRNLNFNKASRIMGSSTFYIFIRNIFPATLPIVITNFMFIIPSTVLSEATLGFLGFSLDPLLDVTLGSIISTNSDSIIIYPLILVLPGIVLFFITFSTQLMGDAVNKVNREGAN